MRQTPERAVRRRTVTGIRQPTALCSPRKNKKYKILIRAKSFLLDVIFFTVTSSTYFYKEPNE
jgi:hypothetical protein